MHENAYIIYSHGIEFARKVGMINARRRYPLSVGFVQPHFTLRHHFIYTTPKQPKTCTPRPPRPTKPHRQSLSKVTFHKAEQAEREKIHKLKFVAPAGKKEKSFPVPTARGKPRTRKDAQGTCKPGVQRRYKFEGYGIVS